MKALVIAEKPSVAMALASVLGARTRKDGYVEGNGYIVSWCVGHLVGLCDASEYDEKYKKWRYEDLPIVPECWKHKILEGTKKQFGILKKLMRDSKVDEVICATDAGREGELIFRLVYEQAGCRKPMKRLWISSMEEQAIKDGFSSLKDGSCYDSLYQSALCRAKADWLVGINASRLFSVLYNQNLKVGRVQTPTLAMIVDRNQKIKEFTKEKYYMAHIKFDDMDAVTEHFQKKEDEDYIIKSPVRRIHRIKAASTIKETYTDEQLESMRDNCDNLRDLALIDILASTGMRVGELVLLNKDDISFDERECVVFGKGDKERMVYFDARTKIHLQNYLDSRSDSNEALFVSLKAPYNRMKIGGIELRLREMGRKLNIEKVHPHKFRRTLATVAIDKGMPIEQLQKLLGHQRIDTTLQYAMVKQSNVKFAHRKYIG